MATPCSVAARFSDDILLFLSSAHPLSGRGAQTSAPRVFIPARCWDISLDEMISLLYFYRHYYPTYRIIIASKDEYQQIIKTAEAELFDYHLRLKSFLDHLECHSNVNKDYKDYKVDCQRWKETFNSLINNFADTAEALMQEYPDSAIQICRRELLL